MNPKAKERVVVPADHLPVRPPLGPTLLAMMAMDYYRPPELARGVVWTLVVVMWVGFIMVWSVQRQKPLAGYGEHEVTP